MCDIEYEDGKIVILDCPSCKLSVRAKWKDERLECPECGKLIAFVSEWAWKAVEGFGWLN